MMDLGENLLRFQKSLKIIAWDTETESLSLRDSRPWQLAFNLYEGSKLVKAHNYFIWWPDLQVSKDAARITRFDYDQYKQKARPPEEILPIFEKYLYDPAYHSLAQNGLGFDIYQHNTWRRQLGLKPDWSYLPRAFDTMCLSKAYKLGLKRPENVDMFRWQWQLLEYKERGLKTSLTAMAREFSIPMDESKLHDANADVALTFQIFLKLIWSMDV